MSFEEFIATVRKEHFYEGRSHKEYEILSVTEQTIVVKDVSKDKVLKIPADKLYEGFDTLGVEKCSSDRLKTYVRTTNALAASALIYALFDYYGRLTTDANNARDRLREQVGEENLFDALFARALQAPYQKVKRKKDL